MSERFESQVRSLTFKGLGVVSHPSGQVFFVRGAWPGDEGLFEVIKLEKNYGYAKIIELTKKSGSRRDAPCPHMGFEMGKCGGCPWMIADYSSQLYHKDQLVKHLLERGSVLTDKTQIHPIIGSSKEFNYRNRAQFKTNGKAIGYVSTESNELAEVSDCMILTDKNRETFNKIKSQLPNKQWEPQEKRNWNLIDIDESTTEISLNTRKPFNQANQDQNQNMKNWLDQTLMTLDKNQNVLELFCGSGNFTENLSQAGFQKILAVEVSEDSIQSLKSKNLPKVEAIKEDIFKPASWAKLQKIMKEPKVLLLDPPREGFSEIHNFLKIFKTIEHIIYISCDLSTFTNDVKKLRGSRFELIQVQPVDQFPQTPHIEILSYLTQISD
jgi:23S rRNA (uracil1939-C5)-methyltransferase